MVDSVEKLKRNGIIDEDQAIVLQKRYVRLLNKYRGGNAIINSRRQIQNMTGDFKFSQIGAILKFVGSLIFAICIAFIPTYTGMNDASVWTLFILLFAAALWISEAIPAFAVSLLIIGLEIMILGRPGGVYAETASQWKMFLQPWASPLIFLFLAGFIMAYAASKTKLDLWIAKSVLNFFGDKPKNIMTGLMLVTFVFSMFISNTATTAMMLAVLIPIISRMKADNKFAKGLLLGVVVAANVGGMGTIIGTPPNAIAVGALGDNAPSFLVWMLYATPPAILLAVLSGFLILKMYPSNEARIKIDLSDDSMGEDTESIPSWKKISVLSTFAVTIGLWLSGPLHGIPTTVVAFIPVIVFTVIGILDSKDIRNLSWDVLILIIGGLSLGLAVSKSGLAEWIAHSLPLAGMEMMLIVLVFCYVIVAVGNFMSHTAAANIMMPIVIAVISGFTSEVSVLTMAVIMVALSSSNAMMFPVSTPPNALVFSSGRLQTIDFIKIGSVIGIFGPMLVFGWFGLVG